MLKTSFCLLALALLSTNLFSHSNHQIHAETGRDKIVSIKGNNYYQVLKFANNQGLDIAGVDFKEKIVDIVVNDKELEVLETAGFNPLINFVQGISQAIDERYKNPQEIETILKDFQTRYPEISELKSIGVTEQGRDIWALKISDNVEINESSEPSILFNSMHHAREIMTPEIALDIVEYLLTNYENSSVVKNWVNNNQIYVVPMLNVDGNNKVWNGNSWWRKNLRDGHGVDINRNYPYKWGTCRGSSGSKWSDTYRGPSKGSEPETQALMNLVAEVRPVIDISYHSYSEILIYPYGCDGERAKNREVVEGVGAEIGGKIDYVPGTAWELLYSVDGSDIDWMHAKYQVLAYVIELNSRSVGFHPDYDEWRDKTVLRNRAGWQRALNRLDESGIRGVIPENKLLQNPSVEVETVVKEKNELYGKYTLAPNNSFHIVTTPGEYIVKLMSNGELVRSKKVKVAKRRININL